MAENLTSTQQKALIELKQLMKDETLPTNYEETIFLIKFLKARDFNVKQAESMLKKHLRWRKEMQIDSILTDFKPSEVLNKYLPMSHLGCNKEGYPIIYAALGNVDGKGVLKSTNIINTMRYVFQVLETSIRIHKSQSEKLRKPITQTVNIYDASNLSLAQITHKPCIKAVIRAAGMFQDNYPEFLKKIYVINASVYFKYAWHIFKSCMASAVLEKFVIYGEDGWKEELLKTIDADVLPDFLGGNRTDPDGNPKCLTSVNPVGKVPVSYYLEKNINKIAQKPGVKTIKLSRQDIASIPVHIKKDKSIINWEFETKDHDISFGLLLEAADGSTKEEIIPVHKVETELEPDVGLYRCEKAGNYVILFDNSYSWFHQKDVYYRIWVTDANGIEIE